MKNDRIVRAYDRNAPNRETEERIWQRIRMAAETENIRRQSANAACSCEDAVEPVPLLAKAERSFLRRIGCTAACLALTVTVLVGGYHGYLSLVELSPQAPISGQSGVKRSSDAEQDVTDRSDNTVQNTDISETGNSNPEATFPEEKFRLQATEILAQAGLADLKPEDATLQETASSDGWKRSQVTVNWRGGETPISVVFDAKDCVFLWIEGLDWVICADSPCVSQADADALAQRLYHSLPVNQSYVIAGCNKYDAENWTYDFCREVEPDVYSWAECVRLSVNPVSGEAKFIKAFYVPLLDDHRPEDVPLTREKALNVCGFDPESIQDLENSGRLKIKKTVAVPFCTNPDGSRDYANYSDVSRICWEIEYHEPESEDYIAGGWVKYVDYYSGEVIAYGVFG